MNRGNIGHFDLVGMPPTVLCWHPAKMVYIISGGSSAPPSDLVGALFGIMRASFGLLRAISNFMEIPQILPDLV